MFESGMSERYREMIEWAATAALEGLPPLGRPTIPPDWGTTGIDALPEPYKELSLAIGLRCEAERDYELSYNQLCNAFARAMKSLGWL